MEESINMDNVVVKSKTNNGFGRNNKFITEDFILMPLYKKIEIDKSMPSCDIMPYNDFRLELFCPECQKRRIFSFSNSSLVRISYGPRGEEICNTMSSVLMFNHYFNLKAKGDCNHNLLIVARKIDNGSIEKIGQYPSIYDLNEEINNKKFLKILDKEYKSYYKTACSLFSFNTCIGALTYLRRIFEKILLDTYSDNAASLDISLDDFKKLRMEDKVKKLKKYLPLVMFNQGFNQIYIKISDGIHNLSEEDCSNMFIVLKDAIEEILIDKMEKSEKAKRQKKLTEELSKI